MLPAVGHVTETLNKCFKDFGLDQRAVVRSDFASFRLTSGRAITEEEKAKMGKIIVTHLNETIPGGDWRMESFAAAEEKGLLGRCAEKIPSKAESKQL